MRGDKSTIVALLQMRAEQLLLAAYRCETVQ